MSVAIFDKSVFDQAVFGLGYESEGGAMRRSGGR